MPRLLGDLRMQAGRLDGPTDLPAHRRHEGDFVRAMAMSLLVLQVDDADHFMLCDDGHGQEGLMTIFGQVMKPFEPGIIARITGDRDGPPLLRHPSRNALAQTQSNSADQLWMGVF